jgi:hypothetical protein
MRLVQQALVWATVVACLLVTACNRLALEQSITMESVYPGPNQTDVTIKYTVPPPPPGKVYVLWILNPDQHQALNAGTVPAGSNLTARASVSFMATGAIVSIEDQPNPVKMSSTWALKVGTISVTTPTPGAIVGTVSATTATPGATTPTVAAGTPAVVGTPSANNTPAVATP